MVLLPETKFWDCHEEVPAVTDLPWKCCPGAPQVESAAPGAGGGSANGFGIQSCQLDQLAQSGKLAWSNVFSLTVEFAKMT